ncbi:MAG TPA: hypothetical protein VE082_04230 [Desulfobaccales bacterium]|nr:hypothetical protein [Desulfobaccales bacterium]
MEERWGFLLAVVALGVFIWVWTIRKSKQMVAEWARQQGLLLVSSEFRLWRRGPFFWKSSRNQTVLYVTVRMPDGSPRSAFIRCGSWWLGLLQDQLDVKWVESEEPH